MSDTTIAIGLVVLALIVGYAAGRMDESRRWCHTLAVRSRRSIMGRTW